MSHCRYQPQVLEWFDKAPSESAFAVKQHVATCDSCRELFDTLTTALDTLKVTVPDSLPDGFEDRVMGRVRQAVSENQVQEKNALNALILGGLAVALLAGFYFWMIVSPGSLVFFLVGVGQGMRLLVRFFSLTVTGFQWIGAVPDMPVAALQLSLSVIAVMGSLGLVQATLFRPAVLINQQH